MEENIELQKALEEAEKRNLELQKTIEEKNKFFNIIAHDLRSPFNGFLGLTEMLADEKEEMTDVEEKEIKKMLHKSAVNTHNLLEDLLEWSRMQQGTIPFSPMQIYLLNKVKKNIELFQELAKNKGIEIICQIPWNIHAVVDVHMFKTIIRNLVSNAIKFTENGRIVISAREDENFVQISISDTGIGMSPSMFNDLFKIEVNTSRRGTKEEPSTGFGLLLSKDFIERHGGKLWVESEEGKGTTFHFTVPIDK